MSTESSLTSVEGTIKEPDVAAKAATPMSLSFSAFAPYYESHLPLEHVNKYGALNVLERLHNIINLTLSRIVELNWNITPANVEQVVAIVQAAYDKYVAPIDIPGIPNTIEPMFDQAIRNLIGPLVRAALAEK